MPHLSKHLDLVCPCQAGKSGKLLSFRGCCAKFTLNWPASSAPSAADLMRSRYSAYATNNEAYLLNTWHESTRPQTIELGEDTKWLGLEVKRHVELEEARAEVEFVARYRIQGKGHRLHEISQFVRTDGVWYYIDGKMLS